jgi:hypothetical protein
MFKAQNSKRYLVDSIPFKLTEVQGKATKVLNIGYWDFEFVCDL